MMFELFRTRSVERDRITDERRIASLMASLDSFLDECITERTGLLEIHAREPANRSFL